MGFPVNYSDLILAKLLFHTLSLLTHFAKLISTLCRHLGCSNSREIDISDEPAGKPEFFSISAVLLRELLPAIKFSELVDPPEDCAICLCEFAGDDEIRPLTNCRHVFHGECLDRWMGYDQKSCPMCRRDLVPDDMFEEFNDRLWAAAGIPEFYGEYI